MKKGFMKSLVATLMACILAIGLFACGTSYSWKKEDVTLKNWGAVVSSDGFVAETENYIYYINGIGDNAEDNGYGKPIKGALMAVDKTTMKAPQIVVPQIFAAQDYQAGIFIQGDYVYYGTPCTDLNSEGKVAYNELTFAKTKLDGSETHKFFTVTSLSDTYRMLADGDGNVHIVFYDKEESCLVDYNTATEERYIIAKTDEEAQSETLDSYKLVDAPALDDAVVLYTTKIYSAPFNQTEKDELGDQYSRPTQTYNKVYAYKLGDAQVDGFAGVNVLDGTPTAERPISNDYSLTYLFGEYCFIEEQSHAGTIDTIAFAGTVADLYNKQPLSVMKNGALASDDTVIISLEEAYIHEEGKIIKTTLIGDETLVETIVAKTDKVNTLYFVEGDYIYFSTSDNGLARIKIKNVDEANDDDKNIQLVSEGTISLDWYLPQVVDGKVFYIDNTTVGASYVHYVALDATVEAETDDDGNVTERNLAGRTFLGMMTDNDIARVFEGLVEKVTDALDSGKLVDDDDTDDVVTMAELDVATTAFEALTDQQKDMVGDNVMKTYKNYVKALELSNVLNKLKGVEFVDADKESFRPAYEEAIEALEEIAKSNDYKLVEIRALVEGNGNYYYQQADKYFTAE